MIYRAATWAAYAISYVAVWFLANLLLLEPMEWVVLDKMTDALIGIAAIAVVYCAGWGLACRFIKAVTLRHLLQSAIVSLGITLVLAANYWIFREDADIRKATLLTGIPLAALITNTGVATGQYGDLIWDILCFTFVFLNNLGIISIITIFFAPCKDEKGAVLRRLAMVIEYIFAYSVIWVVVAASLFFTSIAYLIPESMAFRLILLTAIVLMYCASWILACRFIKAVTLRRLFHSVIASLILALIFTFDYWIRGGRDESDIAAFVLGVPLTMLIEDTGVITSLYGEMVWGLLCSVLVFLNSFGIISVIAFVTALFKQNTVPSDADNESAGGYIGDLE